MTIPCQPQFRVFQPAPAPVGFIGRSPQDSINTDIGVGQLDGGDLWSQPKFVLPLQSNNPSSHHSASPTPTTEARAKSPSPCPIMTPLGTTTQRRGHSSYPSWGL